MTIKRAPQMASTLTLEEHRRVTKVVTLLATVARRVGTTKRRNKKTQQQKKENGVRKIRGPCFFAQNFYHGVIDFASTQSDYHDRYHNTNIAQRYVPDN